jgi:glyoxylase-like metal-dependent hydrolase (beta-lactamase superfamily II)
VRRLRGVDEDLALVPLFGHTRGHSGVAVRSGDGWLLHAGDAYFHAGTVDPASHTPLGVRLFERVDDYDSAARLANAARLRELNTVHGGEVSIFCSHDADELARCQLGAGLG